MFRGIRINNGGFIANVNYKTRITKKKKNTIVEKYGLCVLCKNTLRSQSCQDTSAVQDRPVSDLTLTAFTGNVAAFSVYRLSKNEIAFLIG